MWPILNSKLLKYRWLILLLKGSLRRIFGEFRLCFSLTGLHNISVQSLQLKTRVHVHILNYIASLISSVPPNTRLLDIMKIIFLSLILTGS